MLGDKLAPVLAADGEMLRKVKQSTVSALADGSPYVVGFFEDYDELNTTALGWAATVHGVRRIEDTGFSRGQAVVHVHMTEGDLV
ncbi:MAG TPA: hypothetical protein VMS84_11950 [Mycobacterium sp.]|jgi:hypothetical protein|nr:hypothetical protein [Mycobacterium sp.]